MARGSNVFKFPLDEHSTDSGLAGLGAAPMDPVPWTASAFDRPGHASERVEALRRRNQLKERLIPLVLLLVAVGAAALVFLFSPR